MKAHRAPAVYCDPALRAAVESGIAAVGGPGGATGGAAGGAAGGPGGEEAMALFDRAGHDAMAVAAVTGVGMLFVRCADGISHHPDESVRAEDVAVALDALEAAVLAVAERRS